MPAAKVDVRNGSPTPDAVAGLDEAVRAGRDSWSGGAAQPLKETHGRLAALGVLPDIGPH